MARIPYLKYKKGGKLGFVFNEYDVISSYIFSNISSAESDVNIRIKKDMGNYRQINDHVIKIK